MCRHLLEHRLFICVRLHILLSISLHLSLARSQRPVVSRRGRKTKPGLFLGRPHAVWCFSECWNLNRVCIALIQSITEFPTQYRIFLGLSLCENFFIHQLYIAATRFTQKCHFISWYTNITASIAGSFIRYLEKKKFNLIFIFTGQRISPRFSHEVS